MIPNAHIILIAVGFMRSPSNDLWSPLREEVIHETCMNKHKERNKTNKQENHSNLSNLKNSIWPAGQDIGKQTKKKPISQNNPHCERDPNYYAL